MKTWESYFISAIVIFIAFCLFMAGRDFGKESVRTEAIAAGVAHYEADPKTGEVKFKYNSTIKP